MRIVVVVLFFSFQTSLFAQTRFLDSVKQVVKSYTKLDSHYLRLAHSYSIEGIYHKDSFYVSHIKKAIEVANKMEQYQYALELTSNLASYYNFIEKDNITAIDYYTKALSYLNLFKPNQIPKDHLAEYEISFNQNLGIVFYSIEDFKTAYAYLNKVKSLLREDLSEKIKKKTYPNFYLVFGNVYYKQKNIDSAYLYLHLAAEYGRQYHSPATVAVAWSNMIPIFNDKKIYDSALLYAKEAQRLARRLSFSQLIPNIYGNMGASYYGMQNDTNAIKYSKYAIDTAKLIGDVSLQIEAYKTLIKVYERQENFELAYYTFDEMIALKDSLLEQDQKSQVVRTELKYISQQKEEVLKREIAEAKLLQEKVKLEAIKRNALFAVQLAKEKNLRQTNEYNATLKMQTAALNLEKEKAQKQQITFAAEQNRLQSQAEINNAKNQKNSILLGSIIVLLTGSGIFWMYKKRKDFQQLQQETSYKVHLSETEMKILRLQLNPHFIFNSLNSIADYIRKSNTEQADYYLTKFAKLMRSTLESSEEKEITLKEELKMIELYVQLESLRLNNELILEVHIDPNLNTDDIMLPPLILQPFVENSIWHGLSKKQTAGTISIHIKIENEMLAIYVDDNGVGRKLAQEKTVERKSFGLGLTQERIELLNRMKNTKAQVKIIDLTEGTRVALQLPIMRA